jgi:hypothetical protein
MCLYGWIAIGEHLFGGRMNSSVVQIIIDSGSPGNYILNNFNDFGMAFVTCWGLLIVNNWNYQVTPFFNYGFRAQHTQL